MRITPTNSDSLTPDETRLAAQAVATDGYIILEKVLSDDFMQTLRAAFQETFEAHVAKTDPNRGANRYQMHLPFQQPFVAPEIIENPLIIPLLDALLGKDYKCHYFASDTPLPGSDYQRVHSDIALLFPETPLSLPTYSVVLNIPLVDFTEENGPVEIWPGGTHYMPGPVDMETLSQKMHSERVTMPAGSLLLRDMRMWHRGTPNRADHARPNLALIYSRPWLDIHYPPIRIPGATYDVLSDRAKRLFRYEKVER